MLEKPVVLDILHSVLQVTVPLRKVSAEEMLDKTLALPVKTESEKTNAYESKPSG
jgi:hypothetical protein